MNLRKKREARRLYTPERSQGKTEKRRKSKNTSRESSAGTGNCTEIGAEEGGSITAFKQADIGISLANNVTA